MTDELEALIDTLLDTTDEAIVVNPPAGFLAQLATAAFEHPEPPQLQVLATERRIDRATDNFRTAAKFVSL